MNVSSVVALVGSFVVCAAFACSSSSTETVLTDAGQKHDATSDDTSDDATPEAAASGSCSGLDAAVSGLTFPASCETCIGQHCCSQAIACAAASGCKAIEECAATCVANGTAAQTCAEQCIAPDGSTSNLSPGQNAAYTLDICLAANCSSFCS